MLFKKINIDKFNQKIQNYINKQDKIELKKFLNNFNKNIDNIRLIGNRLKTSFFNESLIDEFREKIQNKIFTLQKFKDYIREKYFNPNIEYKDVNIPIKSSLITKKVILVLSGGGARGAAHVGVLKRLEELNIYPEIIIGTSVGAMVGALYAAGYNADNIYNIMKKEYNNFLKLGSYFFIKPKKATDFLRSILVKYLDKISFKDLKIPLYLNTADVNGCQRVIFSEGELIEIVLASAAIPFVLDSIKIGNMLLMDGGVCDNFCIDLAKNLNRGKNLNIIVSDVSAATDYTSDITKWHFLFKISQDFVDLVKKIGNSPLPVKNKNDIFSISNNLLYMLNNRQTLGPENTDGSEIIVTPLLYDMAVQDFHKILWAYDVGYDIAKKVFLF